ncbi:Fe(3+) dicitrate ABC transporter substrate-binding protein [Vibrio natriegens]|uniref:Fe(3+) dicitrate ABC transporter substrate-binding protein n=1 Tax=Vibrio natriegens TaxID=691 RepID=UPI0021E7A379|nr:Fe(3+) dicitrate ABC transporter substrate-binding protein [Vibrio natriegens]UYI46228.1 Fe(3+) dicitrate ABC transporter substrate-binding protein [Vibrio natriegens]
MRLLTVLLVLCASTVQAKPAQDSAPKRIVVLEYSFVDALAVIGISPVGVADDKDPTRIIPQVRDLIKPWTSVGMRSQPNLEVIAQLKPDLIIADSYRHKISLHDLSQIAPTILLKSRGETYQEGLKSALAIGKAVGKEQEMKARLAKHRELMASYKGKFKTNGTVQFANVNERGMWMHGPLSYTGSLLSYLGLQPALPDLKQSHLMEANLEVLLKVNPDWLFYSKRAGYAVLDNWHKSPLFKLLKINKTGQEIQVSPELWSLNRGILAAESIVKELDAFMTK